MDLSQVFEELPTTLSGPTIPETFVATRVPGYPHRVARDSDGRPSALIQTSTRPGEVAPPIGLKHLEVKHDLHCRVVSEGPDLETGDFTLVRCLSRNRTLQGYFERLLGNVIEAVGINPTPRVVNRELGQLIELFRSLSHPQRRSTQGLWAEVLLIALGRDPSALVQAWHATPEDRFDFSLDSERVEVKSSGRGVRQHHFALDQVYPPRGTTLLVASMFVGTAGGGTSLQELADRARSRLKRRSKLAERLDSVLLASIGDNLEALDERFDGAAAKSSLRYYPAEVIPRPPLDLPHGVTDVHFQADLSGRPAIAVSELRGSGQLLRGLP